MTTPLHHFLDATAERSPEKQALRFSGVALTYAQLSSRASQLAETLAACGVRPGDRVGIYGPKSLESGVSIYGILNAGAAYVPLDATAPPARTALILRDCGIKDVVVTGPVTPALSAVLGQGITLRSIIGIEWSDDDDRVRRAVPWTEVDEAPPRTPPARSTTRDALAYILYTSGSTGAPKGVAHTHGSAVAFAKMAAQEFLEPGDRVTNHAPLHFDLSTLDYFATAVAGATTVIVPEAHTKLPASLSKLLQDEAVTVLYTVPLALAQLLLHGALGQRDLAQLRWVLFAGEAIPPKHLRALAEELSWAQFANLYGPTEVNAVTRWIVPSLSDIPESPVPIGLPFPSVELAVVDSEGTSVPTGQPGELWVHSPTTMQGYWGRPDLNADAFAVPTADPKGREYYKTGDLVRLDEDQVLHFLGRQDRQIKTRGYRVELDEVEAALASHPMLASVAVYAVSLESGSNAIEAAAVPLDGQSPSVKQILADLGATLPPYALPVHLELLPTLPRTASGKVDRAQLKTEALARQRGDLEEASA